MEQASSLADRFGKLHTPGRQDACSATLGVESLLMLRLDDNGYKSCYLYIQGDGYMVDPRIFSPFVKMVRRLPAKAIIEALEVEYRMVQNDFERGRYALTDEALSIFYFREFIQMAKSGGEVFFARPFPPEHCEFYRQTLVRLIEANEVPPEAIVKFDQLFSPIRFLWAA